MFCTNFVHPLDKKEFLNGKKIKRLIKSCWRLINFFFIFIDPKDICM
jgi:hypothetical protein